MKRARELRRKMTLPEVLLWQAIGGERLDGARFRRQHSIGPYILDFYSDAAKLAVEIDGVVHDHPDQVAHDDARSRWLALRGIKVYRIAARDVLGNLQGVLASLRQRLCGQPPPPLRGPPPPEGED
ncbi:endonuclease domain-containing protein [Brevundimonas sp. VNH65]|uniref:endonuclease domain-containing protein n=1 Tax=Brevundimonas sp. VNH65 TaxID=3400917 RepID=UPI003C0125DC